MELKDILKEHTDAVEAKLKDHGVKVDALNEEMRQLEQKMARRGGSGAEEFRSLGAQLAKSERMEQYKSAGAQGSVRFQLKAITSADTPSWSMRDPEIVPLARRAGVRVRDLLTVVPTSAGSVDYAKQTTRTNNAAVVAEATTKPTSAYVWQKVNLPMRTIAHLAKLTRQAIDDSDQLQGEVDTEMRYGLGLAEDAELLTGDGTGEHLHGLIPNATSFAAPFTLAAPNMIDVVGLALLQQALTNRPSDGVVLHPTDWMKMRLIKDAQGKYILGDPNSATPLVLFDKPVALTQAMPQGDFLAGGFKAQKLYDRMAPEVLIASENVDDFEKNLYTMRCEERLGLAIRAPDALIHGAFAAAITAATE